MIERVCVHIGMPKTGTTLIQATTANLRAEVVDAGAWLPTTPMAAHRLAVECLANPALQERSDVVAIREALTLEQATRHATPEGDCRALILSSEYFSEGSPGQVRDLMASIGLGEPRVSIVVYLRRQDRLLVSGFNQDVKMLGRTAPLTFDDAAARRLDWFAMLEPWAEAFGADAIEVVAFDRVVATGESLTVPLLSACGIEVDRQRVAEVERAMRGRSGNESLPADLLALKFLANRLGLTETTDWLVDEARSRGLGAGTFGLSPAVTAAIIERFRASNRRVAETFLGDPGDLFDEEIDETVVSDLTVPPDLLAELLLLVAGRVGG